MDHADASAEGCHPASGAYFGGSFLEDGLGDRSLLWRIQNSRLALQDLAAAAADACLTVSFPELLLQQLVLSDQGSTICLYVAAKAGTVYRIEFARPRAIQRQPKHHRAQRAREGQASVLSSITANSIAKVSLPQAGLNDLGDITCFALCGGKLCLGGSKGTMLILPSSSFADAARPATVLLLRPPESQFQRFIGGLFRAAPTSPVISATPLVQPIPCGNSPANGFLEKSLRNMRSLACALHADGNLRIWDTASNMQVMQQALEPPEAGCLAQQMQHVPGKTAASGISPQQEPNSSQRQGQQPPTVASNPTDSVLLIHWGSPGGNQTILTAIRIQATLGDEDLVQASVSEGPRTIVSLRGSIRGAAACKDAASGAVRCWTVSASGAVSLHGEAEDEPSSVQLIEDAPHWEHSLQASLPGMSVSSCPMPMTTPTWTWTSWKMFRCILRKWSFA